MLIKLSSQQSDEEFVVFKKGMTLTINGEEFDFSFMSDGDYLPREAIDSKWFDGNVYMRNGQLELTLLFPIPVNYSQEQAFPADLVDVPDGQVEFPKAKPEEVVEIPEWVKEVIDEN